MFLFKYIFYDLFKNYLKKKKKNFYCIQPVTIGHQNVMKTNQYNIK